MNEAQAPVMRVVPSYLFAYLFAHPFDRECGEESADIDDEWHYGDVRLQKCKTVG